MDLEAAIAKAWEERQTLSPDTKGAARDAVEAALADLDSGKRRVAEQKDGEWVVHEWLKKAVLLSFRLEPKRKMDTGAKGAAVGPWFDKVPNKFGAYEAEGADLPDFRAVPGAIVRRGAFIGEDAVLMPSFVNIGAYVGARTMVDTWSTIGSCAQIGKDVHISGGVGIGGVLEPLQASPVIIEDGAFIGARSEIAEGVHVGEGAVVSMGVFIAGSTKIVDRATGAVHYGKVPPFAVVVPGTLPDPKGGPSLACAVIVKTVDAKTRAKTGINELIRT
jgi:2,3,4,5-tetrahydropyridine-2-carboxylate N-succinyltransferase